MLFTLFTLTTTQPSYHNYIYLNPNDIITHKFKQFQWIKIQHNNTIITTLQILSNHTIPSSHCSISSSLIKLLSLPSTAQLHLLPFTEQIQEIKKIKVEIYKLNQNINTISTDSTIRHNNSTKWYNPSHFDSATLIPLSFTIQQTLQQRPITLNSFHIISIHSNTHLISIQSIQNKDSEHINTGIVTNQTKVLWRWKVHEDNTQTENQAKSVFPTQYQQLQSFLNTALSSNMFSQLDSSVVKQLRSFSLYHSKTLLLTGVQGIGKTFLLDSVLREKQKITELPIIVHYCSIIDLFTEDYLIGTDSSTKLNSLFEQAMKQSPSILILDSLDFLFSSSQYTQLQSTLLTLLDQLTLTTQSVCLIAVIQDQSKLPTQFVRAGRLDKQITLQLLTSKQREIILNYQLHQLIQRATDKHFFVDLSTFPHSDNTTNASPPTGSSAISPLSSQLSFISHYISTLTPGYVSSDLHTILQQLLITVYSRISIESNDIVIIEHDLQQTIRQFRSVLSHSKTVKKQSNMITQSEHTISNNSFTRFSTLGGYNKLKHRLTFLLHHWLNTEQSSLLGLKPISGLLLYGESGVGKTVWAQEMMKEPGLNSIAVR